jgi:hypothetical protein
MEQRMPRETSFCDLVIGFSTAISWLTHIHGPEVMLEKFTMNPCPNFALDLSKWASTRGRCTLKAHGRANQG